MSNLRVYEAARKLNMSAGDLVKLLEEKGIQASPISTIEQDMFDRLLEEIVGGSGKSPKESEPAAPLKLISFKEKAEKRQDPEAKPDGATSEPVKPALSLAPLPADTSAESDKSSPAVEGKKEAKAPAAVIAASPEGKGGAGAVTYLALTLAMLLAVGMAFMAKSMSAQSAQMENLAISMSAAHTRIDHTDKAIALQESRLAKEEAALANLSDKTKTQAREIVRADVTASAEALQEMSSVLPPSQGERILSISKRLAELGSAI